MQTEQTIRLDAPLPDGRADGAWARYQSYPTFSWLWWLRRGYLLWPLGLAYGLAYASWHAAGMTAWEDWPGLALRACFAGVVTVSLGPLLATLIRYRRLPYQLERVLVIGAIVLGLIVGSFLVGWANDYHHMLMQRFHGMSMDGAISPFGRMLTQALRMSLDSPSLIILFAGGGLAVFYYLNERRRLAEHANLRELQTIRERKDAVDMQLAVLQAQVEPHFLFNTLASIRSLITGDAARAAATVDALSDYLRSTLPKLRDSNLEDATLGKQLEICENYLKLMNIRTDGRIKVVIDAPPGARALAFPPFILLTLVENAVKHGIEPKPGPGMIAIRAKQEGEQLTVAVEDDGAGLPVGANHGVGLANVRAQLRNRFGERATLRIESRAEGGTRATIELPA